MNHTVNVRIVEKKIETALGSISYGFLEGFGRALGYAMVFFAVAYLVVLNSDDSADEAPQSQVTE